MRFVLDENIQPFVESLFRRHGWEIFCINRSAKGFRDREVWAKTLELESVLVTHDRPFTAWARNELGPGGGIILIRAEGVSSKVEFEMMERYLESEDLLRCVGHLTVITPNSVSIL